MNPTSKPKSDIVDLQVNKVSLVEKPANGQEFLAVEKADDDAPQALCPLGRAIQHLQAMMGAEGMADDDHQTLIKALEYLKTLDTDLCHQGQEPPAEAPAERVREALEAVLIAHADGQDAIPLAFWRALDLVKDKDQAHLSPSPKDTKSRRLQESARFVASADPQGWEWEVVIMEAGDSKNGVWDGDTFVARHYPLTTLQECAPMFEGARVYVYERKLESENIYDHLPEDELLANPNGFAKNLVGWISRPYLDGNLLKGNLRLLKGADWLRVNLQDSVSAGKADLYGLSIDADGSQHLGYIGGKPRLIVDALHNVRSVDVVTYPAAGGRFLRLVASRPIREIPSMPENNILEKLARFEERQLLRAALRESGLPAIVQAKLQRKYLSGGGEIDFDRLAENIAEEQEMMAKTEEKPAAPAAPAKETPAEGFTGVKPEGDKFCVYKNGAKIGEYDTEAEAKVALLELRESNMSWVDQRLKAFAEKLDRQNALRESQALLHAMVSRSRLPVKAQQKILGMFKGRVAEAKAIQREIDDMRELVAINDRSGDLHVPGGVRDVRVTESEWDKLTTALDGFWANEDLPGRGGHKIRRMRSLQEAYSTIMRKPFDVIDFMRESAGLPGQRYDSHKRYGVQAGRMTESLQTSSWTLILGDSITRRMLAEYNLPSLQTWRQIVSEVGSIKDFRTQRRMRIGGYGLLPTVGQGDSYTPLTSPTDQEALYAIAKKGGTEAITLEMIANDDMGAIRRIPLRLGRAAAQTLYRMVFDLLDLNASLNWSDDTTPLFTQAHGNLGSDPLSPDSLEAGLTAMKRQTAYGNDTERLGLVPKFIVHPPELWRTVKKLTQSEGEPFVNDNDMNPFKELRLQPLEVFYWTDEDNWYLVANPQDIPTIEVGFFNGNEDPELFVSDQENMSGGSMFNADKVTYKIRHIYGVGIMEYRGFYAGRP